MPHSEKSGVSAKQSDVSWKEAAKYVKLTKTRNDLAIIRDWAENQADKHWKDAKEYEAQGRME